jgi:hypothetical protein
LEHWKAGIVHVFRRLSSSVDIGSSQRVSNLGVVRAAVAEKSQAATSGTVAVPGGRFPRDIPLSLAHTFDSFPQAKVRAQRVEGGFGHNVVQTRRHCRL